MAKATVKQGLFDDFLRRRPLWQQLAVLALATALPLLVASYVMFARLVNNERESIREGLLLNAKTLASLIDNEIDTHLAIAETLGRSSALHSGNLEVFLREATQALEFVPGSWLNVVTPDGHIVLHTLRPWGTELPIIPELDTVGRALATGQPQVGNVVSGPVVRKFSAFAHVPVFDGKKPLYVLSISLSPTRFLRLIEDKYGPDDAVGILDQTRKFVARVPDHERRVGTLASEGWRAAIERAPEGITENRTLEGNWSVTGYTPTRHGWTVGVAQLESAIQAPIKKVFWWSLLVFASLTALSFLLAAAVARHASQGMRIIAEAAREVGEGKRVDHLPAPFAEAGTVAKTLVQSSVELERRDEALKLANSTLEIKVSERTRELSVEMQRREEAEATLRQAQKIEAIGQLTGGIAHDFNNLLTIILGNLDTMKRRLGKMPVEGDVAAIAESLGKPLDLAMNGARMAAQLTQRLLAFARRQTLQPERLDLNAVVSSMSRLLRRTLGETIELETVLAAGLWPTLADAAQIESALLNLAINARDAMPEGGRLTIETANSFLDEDYARRFGDVNAGQYVLIGVSDTGAGIAPEILDKVMEPFFTTKAIGHGSGLGLAMVQGFVKQSGGHLRIYSEVGHGTTVKIYLPRLTGKEGLDTTPAEKTGIDTDQAEAHAKRGETILLVEDNGDVLDYAAGALAELGYEVLKASDGKQALDIFARADRIDALFTDVVMPGGMNGRELADQLRNKRPHLPVLFTTGYTRNAIVHHGRLDGDVKLLPKPYTQQDLARRIREVLDLGKR